jgi:hypothetical protein
VGSQSPANRRPQGTSAGGQFAAKTSPESEVDLVEMECEWFVGCRNESVGMVEHPTLGDVEICQEHVVWLETDFSPTKMIPPMAARAAQPRGSRRSAEAPPSL